MSGSTKTNKSSAILFIFTFDLRKRCELTADKIIGAIGLFPLRFDMCDCEHVYTDRFRPCIF